MKGKLTIKLFEKFTDSDFVIDKICNTVTQWHGLSRIDSE